MKTIEEVIAGLSCNIPCNKNCPYYYSDPKVICRTDDMIEDALQYLKEYQTLIKILNQNTEVKIGEPSSEYKIELTKPEFKNIIIE